MNTGQLLKGISLFPSFLLFIILLIEPLSAADYQLLEKKEMTVLFQGPLRIAAEETASIYPALARELERTLKWKVHFRPTIILVQNSETFQRMADSIHMVAFAIPGRNLVVIDYTKMKTDPFSIETTLKHELCHLLLHHHTKRETLPKWLDEGIAQWVSGGISDILMNPKRSMLDGAILSGRYIRIGTLMKRFPKDRELFMLAYEQSRSLVEYIIGTFGTDGLLMVLSYLKEGDEIGEALSKGLSISLDELEAAWIGHLKKKISFLTYMSNHLYEVLFFLAALILIYGFIKRLIQKRSYGSHDEDSYAGESGFSSS